MSKTKQTTKKKRLPSIFRTKLTHRFLKENPITPHMIEYICDELRDYAASKDALFIEDFRREMRIPKSTWFDLCRAHPQLKEAVEEAKEDIAYGRYRAAATRHFDKNVIFHTQHRFGQAWRDDDKYQSELKKAEQDDSKQPIHVHLPENKRVININEKGDE